MFPSGEYKFIYDEEEETKEPPPNHFKRVREENPLQTNEIAPDVVSVDEDVSMLKKRKLNENHGKDALQPEL